MAGGYAVGINSETKAFKQGIESGVIEPLEDAQDELMKLGKSRGPEQLERSLEDAQDATEKLKKETKETAEAIEREFKDSYRKVGESAGDGLGTAKDEAKASGREAAASFSGEWDDVGDFLQETAANAFEGFGPLGAAAGAAAAVGLGLATAEIQRQQELAEELRERLMSAYQDAAEEGRTYLGTAQIIAEAQDLMFNPDRAEEYKTLLEDQKRIGADWYTVVQAHTGDLGAQEEIQGRIKSLIESEAGSYESIRDGIQKTNPEVQAMADRWQLVNDKSKDAAGAARDYKTFVEEAGKADREQTQRSRDADQARYEGLAQQYANPIKGRVELEVDDTKVRNYRPPKIQIDAIVNARTGRQIV